MESFTALLNRLCAKWENILFFSAMRFESSTLQQQIAFGGKEKDRGLLVWRTSDRRITLVQLGMGAHGKESDIQHFLENVKPGLIINYGIAGALNVELRQGAGFSVDEIYDHHFQRVKWINPLARDSSEIKLLTTVQPVLDARLRERLLKQSRCDIVDMEAAVLAGVSSQLAIPFVCLKVVSDLADENAVATVQQNMPALQENMLKILRETLRQLH